METSFANDQRTRAAYIDETQSIGAQITELAGHINAATYRFLSLIAEFDRRSGWPDGATQSCAHWLNWKCGISFCAAREKVRTARALEHLPKISAAMERGEISYSKVREITRVACPATEDYLLMIAIHGTAHHVERLVRYYRHAKESEELTREEQQQANRSLQYFYDQDGSLVIKARLPAQAGALLMKAIDAAVKDLWKTEPDAVEADTPAGTSTVKFLPTRTKRADALELLAESFLQHGAATLSGGDKHQIVVHVDAETLQTGCAGRCEIEHGTHIAAEPALEFVIPAEFLNIHLRQLPKLRGCVAKWSATQFHQPATDGVETTLIDVESSQALVEIHVQIFAAGPCRFIACRMHDTDTHTLATGGGGHHHVLNPSMYQPIP